MIKLNNKGMTAIELLITFTILSFVLVGMFDMVLNYKNKEQKESLRTSIMDYENKLQKTIQDDLIKRHLVNAVVYNKTNASFQMENDDTNYQTNAGFQMKSADDNYNYQTNLSIDSSNFNIIYGESGKEITYPLPKITDLIINTEETYIELVGTDHPFLKINIALSHPDFEDEELSFSITTPINYPIY